METIILLGGIVCVLLGFLTYIILDNSEDLAIIIPFIDIFVLILFGIFAYKHGI